MARRRDRRVKRHTTITSPREFGFEMTSGQHKVEGAEPPPTVSAQDFLISQVIDDLAALRRRVDQLEIQVKSNGGGGDQLANDIMAFLRKLSPLKVNTGTIASNLNSTSSLVHARLKYLVDRNGVKSAKEEGHSTVYWYEKPMISAEEDSE